MLPPDGDKSLFVYRRQWKSGNSESQSIPNVFDNVFEKNWFYLTFIRGNVGRVKKLLKLLKIESPVGVLVSFLHESVRAQLSEEERGWWWWRRGWWWREGGGVGWDRGGVSVCNLTFSPLSSLLHPKATFRCLCWTSRPLWSRWRTPQSPKNHRYWSPLIETPWRGSDLTSECTYNV